MTTFGKMPVIDDPIWEQLHIRLSTLAIPPKTWRKEIIGSYTRTNFELEAEALQGAPSPAVMVEELEKAGYLVEEIVARAKPENYTDISMFHGLVGVAKGFIRHTLELRLYEIMD